MLPPLSSSNKVGAHLARPGVLLVVSRYSRLYVRPWDAHRAPEPVVKRLWPSLDRASDFPYTLYWEVGKEAHWYGQPSLSDGRGLGRYYLQTWPLSFPLGGFPFWLEK